MRGFGFGVSAGLVLFVAALSVILWLLVVGLVVLVGYWCCVWWVALFGCLVFVGDLAFGAVLYRLVDCWFRLVFVADLRLVALLCCAGELLVVCFGQWLLFVVVRG